MRASFSSTEVTASEMSSLEKVFPEGFPMMFDSKAHTQLEKYDEEIASIPRLPKAASRDLECRSDHGEADLATTTTSISSVDRNNLHRISLLGSGQFCNVYSATGILSESFSSLPEQPDSSKQQQSQHLPRKKRSLLAFKTIDPNRVRNTDDLVVAAIDLANEAKILSRLDHPNIVGLRGISNERFSESFCNAGDSRGDGFFIVLDILKETLNDRLNDWRKNYKARKFGKESSSSGGMSRRLPLPMPSRRVHRLTNEYDCYTMYHRIENIAFGIAEGMEYLHSKQIVLRDLKPSNIGFDFETNSRVRLFDFGMARNITECVSDELCGSPRYMAPEVMAGKGYSLKVDVYSYGVLLFEICSLRSPYADNYWNKRKHSFQQRKHQRWSILRGNKNHKNKNTKGAKTKNVVEILEDFYSHVVHHGLRPSDDLEGTVPCPKIRALIRDCWRAEPEDRPSFTEVLSRLETIFNRPSQFPSDPHQQRSETETHPSSASNASE